MTHAGYPMDRAHNLVFFQQIWVRSGRQYGFPRKISLLLQEKCTAPFHSESVEKEWMRSARIRTSLRYAAATGTAGLCRPTLRIRCPWLSKRGFESKYFRLMASNERRLGRGFCSSPIRANTALENRCFPAGDARPKYRMPWAYLSGTC